MNFFLNFWKLTLKDKWNIFFLQWVEYTDSKKIEGKMKTHLGDGVKVIYRYNLNEYLLSVSNIFSKSTTVVYKHFFSCNDLINIFSLLYLFPKLDISLANIDLFDFVKTFKVKKIRQKNYCEELQEQIFFFWISKQEHILSHFIPPFQKYTEHYVLHTTPLFM